jgi:hypothetical protein
MPSQRLSSTVSHGKTGAHARSSDVDADEQVLRGAARHQ